MGSIRNGRYIRCTLAAKVEKLVERDLVLNEPRRALIWLLLRVLAHVLLLLLYSLL